MLKKAALFIGILLIGIVAPVSAGDQVLSNNSGSGNAPFYISGEKSLVITGFDLNALGIQRPAVIDRVSIAVQTPVAGTPVDVVVYQDANGGSPVDATLAGTQQVTVDTSGTFTAVLTTPITVTQPVVWIGFYLPIDFVFLADTSGTSVLTYWAWTSGGTFDLNNLSSAAVLGPADGTAPVNINMNGIARITAEISGANSSTSDNAVTPGGQTGANMTLIGVYSTCPDVGHDLEDEYISYGDAINLHCRIAPVSESPAPPVGYTLHGNLYDIIAFKDNGVVEKTFLYRITHCIRPAPADIDRAVIGVAYGMPRQWHILPTERFNDVVCAELREIGNLAYFVH